MITKQERSFLFKDFQKQIKKEDTFKEGISNLLHLRANLNEINEYIFKNCSKEDICKMPLSKDKTIAYYLFHLNRIEDITCNSLLKNEEQIFFKNNFNNLLKSPIFTTGNEIKRESLIKFSNQLNYESLKNYVKDVYLDTNNYLNTITFKESKTKISEEKKNNLIALNSVSTDENAIWLIDYWCKKTYAGILLMPFSRHQMLHLDGCLRILKKLKLI